MEVALEPSSNHSTNIAKSWVYILPTCDRFEHIIHVCQRIYFTLKLWTQKMHDTLPGNYFASNRIVTIVLANLTRTTEKRIQKDQDRRRLWLPVLCVYGTRDQLSLPRPLIPPSTLVQDFLAALKVSSVVY